MRFQNPQNGHVEDCGWPGLWAAVFGFFYFAVKGIWTHAVVGLILGACTLGISWFIYPFFAAGIVRTHYLRKGWIELKGEGDDGIDDDTRASRQRIIQRGIERERALRTQTQKESDFDAKLERAGKKLMEKQRRPKEDDDE